MAARVTATWNGQHVKQAARAGLLRAMDRTMTEAVAVTQANTPVRTGRLRGSMAAVPAVALGSVVRGQFGSFGVPYAIFVEGGTRYMAGRFMIRTAADQVFPRFGSYAAAEIGAL